MIIVRSILVLCVYVTFKSVVAQSPQERLCQNFRSCDPCIQTDSNCAWCFQEDFKSDRCGPIETLKNRGCNEKNIMQSNEDSKILQVEDKDFRGVTNPDNIEDSIQLKPQKLSVQIKPKQPINFQFVYRPAEDYPLDLYYLMDLTETMDSDIATMATLGTELTKLLQKLSKNFRVAFGYYSDKVALPFSRMAPPSMENPCEHEGKTCEKAFDFIHKLNFTSDIEKFVNTMNASKTTSNLDNLEGGMDALFQIILCEDYMKWRKNSRKIIVVATDGILHFAGDGILAGAVKRNENKCLLDQDGGYTKSLIYDYPSLEEVYYQLIFHKMNVLFAAKADALKYYEDLNKAIPIVSFVGKLAEKSTNVLNLVTEGYFNVARNVYFYTNASNNIKVTFKTNCNKFTGWNISSMCDNVEVGKEYVFDVTLDVDTVPDRIKRETIVIEEKNIAEKLIIDVEYLGACECDVRNDTDCSGNGVHKCGICECEEGWKGEHCEISCKNQLFEECRYKNETYTSSTCYGRGDCDCGKCVCDEGYTGQFCQDKQCVMNKKGKICSGPSQGSCQKGRCVCNIGYTGEDCSCSTSIEMCKAPGGTVCSDQGTCSCDVCVCNSNHTGQFCEICETCTGLCTNYEKCVLATVTKQNLSVCANDGKPFVIRTLNHSIVVDSSTCYLKHEKEDGFICYAQFRYIIGKDNTVELEIYDDCGKPVKAGTLIGIIIGAVLGIGIILILAWKVKLMNDDRREYAQFKQEIEANKMLGENPLYNSPIRTYEMPIELQNLRRN
ncbi:hypothetical protein RI129_010319 [Pyrocoelia pectoralis]|uniref:Integrin beta n=1 Tax=Pyrocoelia pectoralis TaxID=417401 RepID=A0AAN7V6I4_9COLE